MRATRWILAAAMATLSASNLQAQYFSPATTPNTDKTPFWDVKSNDDGKGCNIGYILTNTYSACKNNKLTGTYSAPYNASFQDVGGNQAWFLHRNGNVNSSWGFGFFAGAGTTITYYGGFAGANPLKDLAIRDLNTNTVVHTFQQNVVGSHTFTLTGNLFFDVGISLYNGGTAFSWSAVTPNQFAVFGNGATYGTSADCGPSGCWVGAEDIMGVSDYDYNDGILKISGGRAVPEPSSVLLVMGGLAGLAGVARRRKQA